MLRWVYAGLLLAAVLVTSGRAAAFVHTVRQGETVAQIAERVYGRVDLERVIVAANGLDQRAASAIVPGMRLQIPTVGHHRVEPGETWQSLAASFLGFAKRADVLARLNASHPWLRPTIGQEIVIPYNLRFVAKRGDTTPALAYRFLGRRDKSWIIASYNRLQRARLRQGEVLLVPLSDLPLTDKGKREAQMANALARGEYGGEARDAQRFAQREIPRLVTDVRRGRYVEAVARGTRLLGRGGLSRPQHATVNRQLTEAYVALDAVGLAGNTCDEWRRADPDAVLDPVELSPKIIRACVGQSDESPTPGPASRDGGRSKAR